MHYQLYQIVKAFAIRAYLLKQKNEREKAYDIALAEVETYDQYLVGDVYSYNLEDKETEDTDSCGGFYGENIWKS